MAPRCSGLAGWSRGRCFHPPDPGAPRRAFPREGRNKRRPETYRVSVALSMQQVKVRRGSWSENEVGGLFHHPAMPTLLEYVGSIHIYLGPYRGNPIALYLKRGETRCQIAPRAYPWNDVVGEGETPNKAANDFEEKWKTKGLSPEMYSGPSWEGGIKPEKPAPPKPATPPPKPAAPPTPPSGEAACTPAPATPAAQTAPSKPTA